MDKNALRKLAGIMIVESNDWIESQVAGPTASVSISKFIFLEDSTELDGLRNVIDGILMDVMKYHRIGVIKPKRSDDDDSDYDIVVYGVAGAKMSEAKKLYAEHGSKIVHSVY